jgi:hypothetical protein
MPRIPQKILDSVVYLYPSEEDARAGTNFGGSGFLVSWMFEGTNMALLYAITNWHVACQGSPVVRVNTIDGDCDVFAFDETEWEFDPRYDIAVHPLTLREDFHKYSVVDLRGLLRPETARDARIGPGDDVFMVGRFMDHDGGKANLPAVRFGNISIDPTPIVQPNGVAAPSYCLDLHSRSGYSGSPVFVYRTPGFDLDDQLQPAPNQKLLLAGVNLFMLLGIHYAQFPELWEVSESGKLLNQSSREPLLTDGKYIRGLSGMTCVLPAWTIAEVLNMPRIKAHRDTVEQEARKRAASTPIAESVPPASDANPKHREDFNSLINAAVKTPAQED